jgi:hypothetical protein
VICDVAIPTQNSVSLLGYLTTSYNQFAIQGTMFLAATFMIRLCPRARARTHTYRRREVILKRTLEKLSYGVLAQDKV